MKRLVPVFVFCLLGCVSCEQNDPKRGGDSSLNQPSDPASWSPRGHRYVAPYEGDNYGFYVYQFFSADSVLSYQTIKSDYSLDEQYEHNCLGRTRYSVNYPTLYILGTDKLTLTFKDTTQLFYPYDGSGDYGLTYTLVD